MTGMDPDAEDFAVREMADKWSAFGEDLTEDEARYLAGAEGDPGFNDFSSREVLAAYRAGRDAGSP